LNAAGSMEDLQVLCSNAQPHLVANNHRFHASTNTLPGLLSDIYRVFSEMYRVFFNYLLQYCSSLSGVSNNHRFHALTDTLPGLLSEIYRVLSELYRVLSEIYRVFFTR